MKLSDYIKALEDGEVIEIQYRNLGWAREMLPEEICKIYREFGSVSVRIKPALKPVDMSVLVGSGIDCVFGAKLKFMSPLTSTTDRGQPIFHSWADGEWAICKPRMNYWFSVKNFDDYENLERKLVAAGFSLDLHINEMYRNGVVAFSITGLQSNRCYPWEAK